MDNINIQYKELVREILDEGFEYTDESRGVQRKQIASKTLNIDLKQGFPAINLKKLYFKSVVTELIWFLRGDTNIKYLVDNGCNIWNKDAYNWYLKNEKETYVQSDPLSYEEFINDLKEGITDQNIENYKYGDLGRVYGAQWRKWKNVNEIDVDDFSVIKHHGLDQISNLIKGLKENPMGTRHLVTAWNPAELDNMALPPCHWSFEVLVEPLDITQRLSLWGNNKKNIKFTESKVKTEFLDKQNIPKYKFTLKWHQRSVDTFLGLPFNIASYALLAHIIGKMTNMVPKALIGDLSNVHLYENSWKESRELLKNDPTKYELPKLEMSDISGNSVDDIINNLSIDMFKLNNYQSYDGVKVEMLSKN